MVVFGISRKETTPFDGQKPGTSGLRKKVTVFQQPNYLHNFDQATFNALPDDQVKGASIVGPGDGPYFSKDVIQNKDKLHGEKLVSVEDIFPDHWSIYGRHYYTRYDYENVDAGDAKELMAHLVKLQASLPDVNGMIKGIRSDVSNVVQADEFEYKDPIDSSVSKHQGIRYLLEDGSRLVFRLSGTGSVGATIRLYIEQYEKDPSKTGRDSQEALAPLVEVALKLSKMQEFTGRSAPTVIT